MLFNLSNTGAVPSVNPLETFEGKNVDKKCPLQQRPRRDQGGDDTYNMVSELQWLKEGVVRHGREQHDHPTLPIPYVPLLLLGGCSCCSIAPRRLMTLTFMIILVAIFNTQSV